MSKKEKKALFEKLNNCYNCLNQIRNGCKLVVVEVNNMGFCLSNKKEKIRVRVD